MVITPLALTHCTFSNPQSFAVFSTIIYCYGMMDKTKLGAAEKAVTIFNEKNGNAYFLPTASVYDNEYEIGAVGHPNIHASKRVSDELSTLIRSILK